MWTETVRSTISKIQNSPNRQSKPNLFLGSIEKLACGREMDSRKRVEIGITRRAPWKNVRPKILTFNFCTLLNSTAWRYRSFDSHYCIARSPIQQCRLIAFVTNICHSERVVHFVWFNFFLPNRDECETDRGGGWPDVAVL